MPVATMAKNPVTMSKATIVSSLSPRAIRSAADYDLFRLTG